MGIKIAHIADVHVKGLARHAEYREAFEELNEQFEANKVEHVFIAGDIYHTKTQGITSEYISLMTWWFNSMAEICEVHMMLGNHDFNQLNLSRMDAISPIVEAIANPRVHLYKHSGVYNFAPGYNWCVYSLFDRENWDDVNPIIGDVNIACYHGPVVGAVSETDWEVDADVKVDFFSEKGYDFCILGDIHKTQNLSFRDVELIVSEEELKNYPNVKVLETFEEKSA